MPSGKPAEVAGFRPNQPSSQRYGTGCLGFSTAQPGRCLYSALGTTYFHQYSTCTPKLEPLRALPKAPFSDNAEPSASRLAACCAARFQLA